MKKVLALTLIGSFLVSFGLLVRFYAYPRLAVIPRDLDTVAVAETPADRPASYFDVTTLREKVAVLRNIIEVTRNADQSEIASADLGRDVTVLDLYSCTDAPKDCRHTDLPLAGRFSRLALDPHSGEALEWKGTFVETEGERIEGATVSGQTVKFPFNTPRDDTTGFWDDSLERVVPMRYVKESRLEGLRVYEFEQRIPPTRVGSLDVPGSLIGRSEASVTVDRMVAVTSRLTVEPESGAIMAVRSDQENYAEVAGERVLTLLKGTFVSPEADLAAAVRESTSVARQLHLVRVVIPAAGGALGVLALCAALVLHFTAARRRRRLDDPRPRADGRGRPGMQRRRTGDDLLDTPTSVYGVTRSSTRLRYRGAPPR